jgi:hypothetical protein
MAARAHVARNYSFDDGSSRPRDVYFRREDPVVLPRSRDFSIDLRLIGAALLATAVVTASTYAVFASAPPALAETPMLPLVREWTPSAESAQANALKALAGPALATRSLTGAQTPADSEPIVDVPPTAASMPLPESVIPQRAAPERVPSQSTLDTPKAQDLVPELPKPEIYPNPTTTPPDGIAPPEVTPDGPRPTLDAENPYR